MVDACRRCVAVVVPPFTQLNTPYASLPALTAWLRRAGHQVTPVDLSLHTALALYSADGLTRVFAAIEAATVPAAYEEMVANAPRYVRVIDPVIRFLQGREPSLALPLVRQALLPQGPRFAGIDTAAERERFGHAGIEDHARHLATSMIQDLADLIRVTVAPHFALTAYAPSVAESLPSFDPLAVHLHGEPDVVEQLMQACAADRLPVACDTMVLSCPFPGTLTAALRLAQWARRARPQLRVILGGGYPSTEMRELDEPRLFDLVDAVALDDAEGGLERLLAADARPVRVFLREGGHVRWHDDDPNAWCRHDDLPPPDYAGLDLDAYLDLVESDNPMHRLWNQGRWLRVAAAHGCYWHKCAFCDARLPYIARFDPSRAATLADRMDALHAATGRSGFHFIDEAAPPALLVDLALELLRRGRSYHWWGNIRFEAFYTADRCRVLAAAGMIAASGGLETAEDAGLARCGKGVTVAEATRALHALAGAGILTHAYLMHGFPGQDRQAVVDGLELVRQLMREGILHAGFYHRFTVTAHSPIGADPAAWGLRVTGPDHAGFARNNLHHRAARSDELDHEAAVLAAAIGHFQRGEGLDDPVWTWFGPDWPAARLQAERVATLIGDEAAASGDRWAWLGERPRRRGQTVILVDEVGDVRHLALGAEAGPWATLLDRICVHHGHPGDLGPLGGSAWLPALRDAGLVVL